MSTLYWIAGAGVQDWNSGPNWSTGSAPASGDAVFIQQGTSDIQTNLSHAAVALIYLEISGSFNGTIQTSTGGPLAIGIASTDTVLINTQATGIVLDFGSSTPQIVITATGAATTSDGSIPGVGNEAVRIRGGAAGTNLNVTGSSSVGIATDHAGLTATLDNWRVAGGNVNLGSGVTWTNGYQAGGSVLTQSAGTLIQQSGSTPILTTAGAVKIAAINITGTGVISNRPTSGVAYDTLTIGPSAIATHANDPRSLTVTNAIQMSISATLAAFSPAQIQTAGPSALQVKTIACGLSDVTLIMGTPVLATITSY